MKKFQLLMVLTAALFLSTANADSRDKKEDDNDDGIQRVKCHVELLGGINTIHTFISESDSDSPENIKHIMVGHKIYDGKTLVKKPIYKIHECVKEGEDFERSLARQIDENLAR